MTIKEISNSNPATITSATLNGEQSQQFGQVQKECEQKILTFGDHLLQLSAVELELNKQNMQH